MPGGGTIYLVEALEYLLKKLRGDAYALILYRDINVSLIGPGSYPDRVFAGAEFDRVIQNLE